MPVKRLSAAGTTVKSYQVRRLFWQFRKNCENRHKRSARADPFPPTIPIQIAGNEIDRPCRGFWSVVQRQFAPVGSRKSPFSINLATIDRQLRTATLTPPEVNQVSIHPLALVSPAAELGRDVEIGPFCTVEANVIIGDGCRLEARASVKSGTTLGAHCHVFEGAVLGGFPQHLRMPERLGNVDIGSHNIIRENCTIHRALHEGHSTVIGDHNLLMCNVHVAHDCHVGSNIVFANNVLLAGHVAVADRVFVSGAVAVHQFCRIGRFAMVGGQAHVVKDIPPFVTVDGVSSFVVGLNLIGLRRNGYTAEDVGVLKSAYRVIYRSGLRWTEVLDRLEREYSAGVAAPFLEFFRGGTRGFVPERRVPPAATIKLSESAEVDRELKKAG
jgi:UDP-N-acetylglucosamine acyltransferase